MREGGDKTMEETIIIDLFSKINNGANNPEDCITFG